MKRLTETYFKQLRKNAPALVISFDGEGARLVPAAEVAAVESGIITLSPIALFFLECQFTWQRFALR